MEKSKFITKLLTGALIGSIALSAGGYAFASNTKTTAKTQSKYVDFKHPGHGQRKGFSKEDLKTKLDTFVKSGTITQDQEDKIISYMEKKDTERKAEMDKIKNMTEEQRKAYFEQNKPTEKTDLFTDLVNQNIITQAQADTIKKSMPEGMHRDGKNKIIFRNQEMKTFLTSQVKAGTITQDEADKITTYLSKKAEERKAEMSKVKAMTEAERRAYFDLKKASPKTDFFTDLVNQGILSQTKADNLKKVMQSSFKDREGHQIQKTAPQNTTTQAQ